MALERPRLLGGDDVPLLLGGRNRPLEDGSRAVPLVPGKLQDLALAHERPPVEVEEVGSFGQRDAFRGEALRLLGTAASREDLARTLRQPAWE